MAQIQFICLLCLMMGLGGIQQVSAQQEPYKSALIKEITINESKFKIYPNPYRDTCLTDGQVNRTRVVRIENFRLQPDNSRAKQRGLRDAIPSANIIVNFGSGFDAFPAAREAFQFAVDIWATEIFSSVPIVVDAEFSAFDNPNTLGSAGPTVLAQINDPALGNTNALYPIALANSLVQEDIAPQLSDIEANFNSGFDNFYFGLDGNPSPGEFDFVSIVLHELGHGLGLIGSGSPTGTSTLTGNLPLIYDVTMENLAGEQVIALDSAGQLGAILGVDGLFQAGANARDALAGDRVPMFAPSTFNQGSSYSHLDETFFSAGDINSLMTPFIGFGEAIQTPGPAVRGIFKDMGWIFSPDANFLPDDIGVTAVLSPDDSADSFGANEQIVITIANFGSNDISNFNVGFSINGGNVNTETFTGTLLARNDDTFTFAITADLSDPSQLYELKVFTSLGSDVNRSNDTTRVFLNKPKNVLYDQFNLPTGFSGIPSTQDLSFNNDLDIVADDFEVPAGLTWKVQRVQVLGFNNANTPIPTARVFFFDDNNGVPGNEIYDSGPVAPVNTGFNFDLVLPNAPGLQPGTYWVSVAGIMEVDFATGQVWGWEVASLDNDTIIKNEAHFINISGTNPNQVTIRPISQVFAGLGDLNPLFQLLGDALPIAPRALPASEVTDMSFQANWQALNGVDEYRIDVSDDNFNTFILENELVSAMADSFIVTGLSPGTTYQYRIRFLDGTQTSVNSDTILVTTCSFPSMLTSIDNVDNTQPNEMSISLTPGDGISRVVLVKEGSDFDSNTDFPVDGVNYVGGLEFGTGEAIGGAFVVANGDVSNITVTGLQAGLNYFIASFERSCTGFPLYLRDGVAATSNLVTSVEDALLRESLKVFPVPAQSSLKIDIESSRFQDTRATLYNSLGLPILETSLEASNEGIEGLLNTENLSSGIYILKITSRKAVTEVKVVIE